MKPKKVIKTALIVYWKCQDKYELYGGLAEFIRHNPKFNEWTIYNWIGRKKLPYQTPEIMIIKAHFKKSSGSK